MRKGGPIETVEAHQDRSELRICTCARPAKGGRAGVHSEGRLNRDGLHSRGKGRHKSGSDGASKGKRTGEQRYQSDA